MASTPDATWGPHRAWVPPEDARTNEQGTAVVNPIESAAPDKSGRGAAIAASAVAASDAVSESLAEEQRLVLRWLESFNARDLNGMLACMSEDVSFQPVRLHPIERTYAGHDGITRWYERLIRAGLAYQIQLEGLDMPAEATVLATGALSVGHMRAAAPFWGVHTIQDGVIRVARHYLSDVDLSERFALQ